MSLRYILAQDPESTNIDAFHALSEHVKQTYETFSYPSERISVVPNALDERFLIPHQSSFEEPYRLLYVGYLEEHKGVRKLIEIMQRLHTDHDGEFRLTIAGDGGLRSELESLAEQSSVDEHIDFLDHVEYERLPDLYANHDLFVYPGEWDEPFGRVFLEALATGTPTIASNVGAADEILGSGGIATSGSVTDIADGIEELCTSGELRSLSEAAVSETERFRRDSVINDFVQLYRDIDNV
jgi:glycosyltransferase involved in cell wall biosynthesis